MKTTKDIRKRIFKLREKAYEVRGLNEDKYKRLLKEIRKEKQILRYLESNPSRLFLLKQKKILEKKIDYVEKLTASRLLTVNQKNKIKNLHKYSTVKNQLSNINYILD